MIGRTLAAIALGLILTALGYLVALAQAMSSSTSTLAGIAAFLIVGVGLTLTLYGIMALWRPHLRRIAGRAMLIVTLIAALCLGIGLALA